MEAVAYLLGVFVPWTAKTVLYHYGFRWRDIHATLQTKIIVAGVPSVILGLIPFSKGPVLSFVVGIGIALYLCRQFTDGKLYPDLVLIVSAVEILASIVIDGWIMPIIL